MKYSIKQQFAGVFCLLIIGTIGVCWFINNTFLENYYIRNKQNVLMNAYNYMNTASNEGKIVTEEFDIEFQSDCGTKKDCRYPKHRTFPYTRSSSGHPM